MRRIRWSSTVGWVGLAAYVTCWDIAAARDDETLSAGFHRAVRHPVSRWPVVAAWTITTLHLFGHLPPRWDPYRAAGRLYRLLRPSQRLLEPRPPSG